jgi:hypothetical protein
VQPTGGVRQNAKENGQIKLPDCRPGYQRDGVRSHRTSILPEDQKTAKIHASWGFI